METENKHNCLYCVHLGYQNFCMFCNSKKEPIVDYPTNQIWSKISNSLIKKGVDCTDFDYDINETYAEMK